MRIAESALPARFGGFRLVVFRRGPAEAVALLKGGYAAQPDLVNLRYLEPKAARLGHLILGVRRARPHPERSY